MDVHLRARLGRHARRGHARRGVRHPARRRRTADVLLLIAFTVVAGTLFIQGLTLPWLARRLHVPAPDPRRRRAGPGRPAPAGLERRARQSLARARGRRPARDPRRRSATRSSGATSRPGSDSAPPPTRRRPSDLYARVRLEMIDAERGRVLEIRSSGSVASEVISDVLAMLDVEESMLDVSQQSREEIRTVAAARRTGDTVTTSPTPRPSRPSPSPSATECLRDGTTWVALRAVPRVRPRRLLRLLTEPPRHGPLPGHHPPGDASPRNRARTGAGATSTTSLAERSERPEQRAARESL